MLSKNHETTKVVDFLKPTECFCARLRVCLLMLILNFNIFTRIRVCYFPLVSEN